MKHIIRDFIIWINDTVGISFLYRAYQRKKGPLVRVIAFHDVKEKEWFEEVVVMLIKNYNVLTPEQFHTKDFDAEKINILLTFDDGYASWVDICAPILKKYKLKGLFFINSGLLDIAHEPSKVTAYMRDRLLLTPKAPLTWEGAQTLVAQGHTIGGHSVNHYNLAVLDQSVLESEIKDDKKTIEERLKVALIDFAYPFGRKNNYNTNVFGIAEHAGYTWQYAAHSSFNREGTITSRTLLEKNHPLLSIKRWIEGGYDIFGIFR
jgi:peptidoglycan/xylan/chitin deacetylase (PgdA/CDA1 family)